MTNATVKKILTEKSTKSGNKSNTVTGVQMQDGSILYAKTVISATTPYHTFMELMGEVPVNDDSKNNSRESYSKALPEEFSHHIKHTGTVLQLYYYC